MAQALEDIPVNTSQLIEDLLLEHMDTLPPLVRMHGLAPAQRLEGLAPAQRLEGLAPAQRLEGLGPGEQILALSDDVLKTLPSDFIRSLPQRTQRQIRARLARDKP